MIVLVIRNSKHDKGKFCILQASAGKGVFKGSNPNYFCVIDPANNPLINSELELLSSVTSDLGDQMEIMIKVMDAKNPLGATRLL